jgi:hypothetical protein
MRVVLCALVLTTAAQAASSDRVFYAGNAGRERFHDVYQLSDGTVLVAGVADNLNWVPAGVTQTVISATARRLTTRRAPRGRSGSCCT